MELMVVLAIIGITSTIAVSVYLAQIEEIRVKGDVRALEQQLQLAKLMAISTNVPHGIAFKRQANMRSYYFIFKDTVGDGMFTDTDTDPSNNVLEGDSTAYDRVIEARSASIKDEDGNHDHYEHNFVPHLLHEHNQFTCIFNSTGPSGTNLEYVLFDPMGRVTPAVGTQNFIGIQKRPLTAGESKFRQLVFIHLNTGLSESLPPQNFTTNPADWCTR